MLYRETKLTNSPEINVSEFRNFSVMPRVDHVWAQRTRLNVYSGLGIGHNFSRYSSEFDPGKFAWAWNLTALGLEYGGPLKGYLDLGYGFNGILNAGIRYAF